LTLSSKHFNDLVVFVEKGFLFLNFQELFLFPSVTLKNNITLFFSEEHDGKQKKTSQNGISMYAGFIQSIPTQPSIFITAAFCT
jgi:hypothetical protein